MEEVEDYYCKNYNASESCAALMPVASATRPPSVIATRIPLPAFAVADPIAPKIPVPMIIAAVISVDVLRPSVRASVVVGSGFPECCLDTPSVEVGCLLICDRRFLLV